MVTFLVLFEEVFWNMFPVGLKDILEGLIIWRRNLPRRPSVQDCKLVCFVVEVARQFVYGLVVQNSTSKLSSVDESWSQFGYETMLTVADEPRRNKKYTMLNISYSISDISVRKHSSGW